MVEQGKDPLISPSAEWLREYQGSIERRHSSSSPPSSSGRRRHRRRITVQTRHARRRVMLTLLVCAGVLLAMTGLMYMLLSREAPAAGDSSRAPRSSPASARVG
jgi:hypothetical protein